MIVDALLDLLVAQRADALVLETDKAPVLIHAGEPRPLSMPPLDAEMMQEVLAGITRDAERRKVDDGGNVETEYRHGDARYPVAVIRQAERLRFSFRSPTAPPTGAVTDETIARSRSPAVGPVQHRPGAGVGVGTEAAPAAPMGVTWPGSGTADAELAKLLSRARIEQASDVLVSTGRNARLRVGGALIEVNGSAVDEDRLLVWLGPWWDEPKRAALHTTGSADLAFVHDGLRYRVNVFRQSGGLAAAFRPIRTDPPTLRELGLPEDFHRLVEYRNGLVLMTGTAGSGKSTSLVALLEHVNRTQPKHVITLEDPIEYMYRSGLAMIHQREVGVHVESFGTGLRAALREAPDVILVGEMRDRDTIAAALTAAETGHLVLSTLHCSDASMAVDRIIDVFPEHQQAQVREQLATVLRAVVTQILLPSVHPPQRVPAYEKLVVTTPVATKIRERRGHQVRSELHTGQGDGMVPLEVTLARLVRERRISRDVARAHAHDPKLLEDHLGSRRM